MGRPKKDPDMISENVISDIPVELSNNLPLISRKLVAFLSYYSAANLGRLNNLTAFIQSAEERLYNIDVNKLDMKELNARYKEAKKAQNEILTIAKQVSESTNEIGQSAKADEVYNLLKGMNEDTLNQLQQTLMGNDDFSSVVNGLEELEENNE